MVKSKVQTHHRNRQLSYSYFGRHFLKCIKFHYTDLDVWTNQTDIKGENVKNKGIKNLKYDNSQLSYLRFSVFWYLKWIKWV